MGPGDETVAKNVAKLSKRLNKESLQVPESKGTSQARPLAPQTECAARTSSLFPYTCIRRT
jgi:hypothetical protein